MADLEVQSSSAEQNAEGNEDGGVELNNRSSITTLLFDDDEDDEDEEGEGGNEEDDSCRVPSLASLCMDVIASKIERYPPEAFGVLSELEWEEIVRKRHEKSKPKISAAAASAAAGPASKSAAATAAASIVTGTTPVIADRIMLQIEDMNMHLAGSKVVDELVWKDCVEYKFRRGGPNRPAILMLPRPLLILQLKDISDDLMSLLPSNGNPDEEREGADREESQVLSCTLQTLETMPMSVKLLTSSGVGKAVAKFVKACHKLKKTSSAEDMVNVWSSSSSRESPLSRLENLLQRWKDLASASGIEVKGASSSSSSNSKTNHADQLAARDLQMLDSGECETWRGLHAALTSRDKTKMAHHGERMREIRRNLETTRPKIGKVSLKNARKTARQEAILNREGRGSKYALQKVSGFCTATATSWGAISASQSSKIVQLRREVAAQQATIRGTSTVQAVRAGGTIKATSKSASSSSTSKPSPTPTKQSAVEAYKVSAAKARSYCVRGDGPQMAKGGLRGKKNPLAGRKLSPGGSGGIRSVSSSSGRSSGFGASVAMATFTTGGAHNNKKRPATTVALGNGKRMRVPQQFDSK